MKNKRSPEAVVLRNKAVTLTATVLTSVATMTATGTLMQTFLATLGLDPKLIYIHATLIQAANVSTLVLGAKWVNNRNVIRRYALITLPFALLFLCYLPICLRQDSSLRTFTVLVLIGLLQAVATALRTVCSYTTPYLLYPAEDYGPFLAVTGVVSGVFSLLSGAAVSFLSAKIGFGTLMTGAFVLSAVLELIEAFLLSRQRSILPTEPEPKQTVLPKKSVPLRDVLRHPVFYTLIVPALLRGFASGTVGILAAVAFELGFDESVTTQMVYLQSAASLGSCLLIGWLSKRVSSRYPVLFGSLTFLLLPLLFSGNKVIFLAAYTAVFFGRNLVDYGVPILMRHAVPMEIAGPYNAWRMILHNGGMLLATSAAAVIPVTWLTAATLATSVLSGGMFFFAKVLRHCDDPKIRDEQKES